MRCCFQFLVAWHISATGCCVDTSINVYNNTPHAKTNSSIQWQVLDYPPYSSIHNVVVGVAGSSIQGVSAFISGRFALLTPFSLPTWDSNPIQLSRPSLLFIHHHLFLIYSTITMVICDICSMRQRGYTGSRSREELGNCRLPYRDWSYQWSKARAMSAFGCDDRRKIQ